MGTFMRKYAPILALAFACAFASPPGSGESGQAAPRGLARRVARNESLIRELRDQYTFRQHFRFEEIAANGRSAGLYRETRDVVFTPGKGRAEVLAAPPVNTLAHIRLTEEDFEDVRKIQNFLFTEDVLWLYRIRPRGAEQIDGVDCWVLEVSPRTELEGMRFFEGLLWVSKAEEEIVRASGKAVPEIHTAKEENLFPHFTTQREKIDGHWMPALTFADDELPFQTGRRRVRLTVEFTRYRRFTAETSIRFGEAEPQARSPEP
ncbi:MAG: hypothetical protein IT169_02885 [Bryobacterales bacterium]|nr:hypothetical protein [Bryobacterales bacterium]